MSETINCLQCNGIYVYEDQGMLICPECAYEWSAAQMEKEQEENLIKDSNGAVLADGDSVIIIKDLKVKGASGPLKQGTKVKNIRLVDGADDHNIDCRIDGYGAMSLKSEFVKKA